MIGLQTAGTLLFGVAAVLTFLLDGKQWPTFITAGIFGAFLGSLVTGPVMDGLQTVANKLPN